MLSKATYWLRQTLWLLTDRVACLGSVKRCSGNVLLVKVDAIGDFVLWLDSARALRERYREQKIILVANHIVEELAERTGYFDEIIPLNIPKFDFGGSLSYRFRQLRKVRGVGAGVAINPTYSRTFWTGDSLIRASGAAERIGSVGDDLLISPRKKRISDRWYTRLVPATKNPLMELERNCEFLAGFGLPDQIPRVASIPKLVDLPPIPELENDYFIVFPGATWSGRMWPIASFAEVMKAVVDRYHLTPVICGSGAEKGLANQLMDQIGEVGAVDLTGRTSLVEFVEIVRSARFLIGNETSAVHIAAATDTPSVCLLGGGHFNRFAPYPSKITGRKPLPVYELMSCYGCNWHCTLPHREAGPVPCVESIQVEAVLAGVMIALSGAGHDEGIVPV